MPATPARTDPRAILEAAREGRVAGLVAAAGDDALAPALFDTVLRGGWAFELPAAEMPAHPAGALLRF